MRGPKRSFSRLVITDQAAVNPPSTNSVVPHAIAQQVQFSQPDGGTYSSNKPIAESLAEGSPSSRGFRSFGISFRIDWHHPELGVSASDSASQRGHDGEGEERGILN